MQTTSNTQKKLNQLQQVQTNRLNSTQRSTLSKSKKQEAQLEKQIDKMTRIDQVVNQFKSPIRQAELDMLEHQLSLNDKENSQFLQKFSKVIQQYSHNKKPEMEQLLTDAQTRKYQNIYKNQVDYLKTLIYALENQNNMNKVEQINLDRVKSRLAQSERSQLELRDSMTESTKEFREQLEHLQKLLMANQEKEISKQRQFKELQDQNDDYLQALSQTQHLKDDLAFANEELKKQKIISGQFKERILNLENQIVKNENEKLQIIESTVQGVQSLEKTLEQQIRINQDQHQKLIHYENMEDQLNQKIISLEQQNRTLSRDLSNFSSSQKLGDVITKSSFNLSQLQNSIKNNLDTKRQENSIFLKNLEERLQTSQDDLRENRLGQNLLRKEIADLKSENSDLAKVKEEMDQEIFNLQTEMGQLKGHVVTLEQLLCVREDIGLENQQLQKALQDRALQSEEFRARNMEHQIILEQQNDQVLELQEILNHHNEVIKTKQREIQALQVIMIHQKQNSQIYVPTTEDKVDIALADLINRSQDPRLLSNLFLREGEGIYKFGSKRVYVKLEQGKVYLRVGGGFLTLQEFLSQHQAIELEKLKKNSPPEILKTNMAMNKVMSGTTKSPQHIPFEPCSVSQEKENRQANSYSQISPEFKSGPLYQKDLVDNEIRAFKDAQRRTEELLNRSANKQKMKETTEFFEDSLMISYSNNQQ